MSNIGDYFKTGLKLLVLGIISGIIYWIVAIPAVIVASLLGTTALIATMILFIPLALIIDGYVAYKLWKWD